MTAEQRERHKIACKERYRRNRDGALAKARVYRSERREELARYQREVVRGRNPARYRSRDSVYRSKRYAEERVKLLSRWGLRCNHCGYDKDHRALQVDHINGDGAEDRKRLRGSNKYQRYLMTAPLERFQVLCANCNAIKREENREYRKPLLPRE